MEFKKKTIQFSFSKVLAAVRPCGSGDEVEFTVVLWKNECIPDLKKNHVISKEHVVVLLFTYD